MNPLKTEQTLELERLIWGATHNQGTFGCFEVTIGWFGKERVDYMTYNCEGEFRCYEIKVTKSDFRSKSANTFLGHFNYYVLTPELYEQVAEDIPPGIGIYVRDKLIRRPRRQELGADEKTLKDSMIRSLCREVDKQIKSGNPTLIEFYKRGTAEAEREAKYWRSRFEGVKSEVLKRYGANWDAGPILFDKDGEVF